MTSCDWCCGDLQFVLDRGVPALIGPHCRQSAHAGTGSGRSGQRRVARRALLLPPSRAPP